MKTKIKQTRSLFTMKWKEELPSVMVQTPKLRGWWCEVVKTKVGWKPRVWHDFTLVAVSAYSLPMGLAKLRAERLLLETLTKHIPQP